MEITFSVIQIQQDFNTKIEKLFMSPCCTNKKRKTLLGCSKSED